MTEEDFVKQMRVLKEKELEIKYQMHELQQQYLKEYPIQINDKCVDRGGKVCWVCKIHFYDTSTERVGAMYCFKRCDVNQT